MNTVQTIQNSRRTHRTQYTYSEIWQQIRPHKTRTSSVQTRFNKIKQNTGSTKLDSNSKTKCEIQQNETRTLNLAITI